MASVSQVTALQNKWAWGWWQKAAQACYCRCATGWERRKATTNSTEPRLHPSPRKQGSWLRPHGQIQRTSERVTVPKLWDYEAGTGFAKSDSHDKISIYRKLREKKALMTTGLFLRVQRTYLQAVSGNRRLQLCHSLICNTC